MTGVTEQRSGLESQSKAEQQENSFERIKCNHMVAQIQGGYGKQAVVQLWNRDHDTAIKLKGISRGNRTAKGRIQLAELFLCNIYTRPF